MVHLRKEATESTLPRMVGEEIYGVVPILAALLSKKREFYGLYIQKGLDLSGNNRKKKIRKTPSGTAPRCLSIANGCYQGIGTCAIIRSAYLFGAFGIVLCANNLVPLSGVVSKASVGSLELMELSEGTELRPLVEMSDTELVRILGKISVDIIVGQDEDVECDNSISGQNYKSFMAVESLNISVATNVPGTSGADIHAALFCSLLKTSQNG
ncbi:hypothetical protein FXO38_23265 [Capsicum annuum]|uniref:Uncharacterized protein n=1 Tax=Capsicum annuum TaxID=4072 RepID=A0A2G3AJL6_CAPAN|nr:hypothetical protein FXO38_23265 [Capsicum annuum]PHT94435.1 hypothetical protein T459_02317 [Capsicum annuum]